MAFKVGDEFRTNKLSVKPGGSIVTVHFINEESKIYDKIKNPIAYSKSLIARSEEKGIVQIDIDGEQYWGKQGELF